MNYVLGIDGGGTKTAAVILDEHGQVQGYGESGPSTYGVVPGLVTQNNIANAARAAAEIAGIDSPRYNAAFLGMGNVVSELDRSAVQKIAADLGLAVASRIGVDHDIRIALAGGLSGRPGMVMIAGTGTSCFGINQAGASWRSGGWGPLIDDEGSSYWLGIQAMRSAALACDGRGQPTTLTQSVSDRLGLADMNELMNRLYATGMTRTEIAALAPLVFTSAAEGDDVAQKLIYRGCEAMADCVLAVARQISLDGTFSELAITGGMTRAGQAFLAPFRAAVNDRMPKCQVIEAELIPAIGAALLALQISGIEINEEIITTVKRSGKIPGSIG